MKYTMWQTSDLDYYVAEVFFGWRWMSFHSRPVRSHPDYPKEMRVRRFYPPDDQLAESESGKKRWAAYFKEEPHETATGDEPLCYCYESSSGPHCVPHFSGHADACVELEREVRKRGLWERYMEILAVQIDSEEDDALYLAPCDAKCIAALAAAGSKYVTQGDSA